MIQSSRRHGHFDPRGGTSGRAKELAAQRGVQGARRFASQHARVVDRTTDGGSSLSSWENEGGSYATADERDPARAAVSSKVLPARLDWYVFLTRTFPGRRRHDLEALEAYEAYSRSRVRKR